MENLGHDYGTGSGSGVGEFTTGLAGDSDTADNDPLNVLSDFIMDPIDGRACLRGRACRPHAGQNYSPIGNPKGMMRSGDGLGRD